MSLDETTLLARLNDGRNIHRTRVTAEHTTDEHGQKAETRRKESQASTKRAAAGISASTETIPRTVQMAGGSARGDETRLRKMDVVLKAV